MNDLIMKAITLSGEEKKVTKNGSTIIKIKDEKGLSYSFFMKKQDGSFSKAYEGYQKFQLGDTVEIHYSEEQRTTSDGKPYTARGIAFFGEKVSSAAPTSNASPRGLQSPKDGSIIRQVAFKGVIELMTAGVLPKGENIEKDVHTWTDRFDRIIQVAALTNPLSKPESSDLPVIQQYEDISVEDIPF